MAPCGRSLGSALGEKNVGCSEILHFCWLATGRVFLLTSFFRRGFVIGLDVTIIEAAFKGGEFEFAAELDIEKDNGLS